MLVNPLLWLRLYLLAGLIAHKALWEVLKRRRPPGPAARLSPRVRIVRAIKTAILVGIVAQTLIPESWMGPLVISENPLRWRLAGVVIYSLGLLIAILGRLQLGENWSDIESARVESEHRVVDRGIYRWIRHPIYVGDLLLLIGLELALNSWLVLGAVTLVPVVLRQAVREERMLVGSLPGYADYCRRSRRFVPFLI